MAGCYGNSKEDKYFEYMLYDYLDSLEDQEEEEDTFTEEEEREYWEELKWEEKQDDLREQEYERNNSRRSILQDSLE